MTALLGIVLSLWLAVAVLARRRGDPGCGPYPAPDEASREIEQLAARAPEVATLHEIGRSAEGRPLLALRLRGAAAGDTGARPRLLVSAQIHAVEFVAGLVARSLAERLALGYGHDAETTALLDAADVWIVPLLNPDGAARVWRRGGWVGLRGARATSRGVDPNRNFPHPDDTGPDRSHAARSAWNAASGRPGSAYYRGPRPLSEPECAALAALAARERFCAAVNFHSIGAVVYLPEEDGSGVASSPAFDVFRGPFQDRQPHRRYRPTPLGAVRTRGQLDPFLWHAFGTPSVTVEVSRPGWDVLLPWRAPRLFWWANPPDPARWLENDVGAALFALRALLDRTGGQPMTPPRPELAPSPASLGGDAR